MNNNKPIAYVDRLYKLYHPECYHALISTPENPLPELERLLYTVTPHSYCCVCKQKIRNKGGE